MRWITSTQGFFFFPDINAVLMKLENRLAPIIHRDLKPDNVFVASDGTIRIGDFGLAIVTTKNSSIGGTPAFMAPEIWTSASYDSKVDIYAFGMLVLEMKTNETPYHEHTSLLHDRANGIKIPPPGGLDRKNFDGRPNSMNLALRELIGSCLEWEAKDRPTAKELLDFKFFHPRLFEIHECEVTFDEKNPKIVKILLKTNVKRLGNIFSLYIFI